MTRLAVLIAVLLSAASARAAEDWLRPSEISPGLWRGRAPYRHRHFEEIKALGVRTILDMRGNQPLASVRERRRAERHGLEYRNEPMGFRPLRDGSDGRVVAVMQDVSAYPMYVHCNVDRDRSSVAVFAYRRRVQGWSQPAAEAEVRRFGLRRYFLGLNRYVRTG
jgi:protein tyrosine/serine phosphatase